MKTIRLRKPKNFNPRFEIVSCFCEYNGKFILLHRRDHKPEGNTWGVVAGKKADFESIENAILREALEETGIKLDKSILRYFRKVYVKFPTYDFIYHMFQYQLAARPEIRINQNEHKAFAMVSPKESLRMNLISGLDECIRLFYQL
ncbi:MAG TPA: NUDIX hydrolase [bacterium]|nr:NUDIX hydrolase [bacterium]